jgi:hypothetical protein
VIKLQHMVNLIGNVGLGLGDVRYRYGGRAEQPITLSICYLTKGPVVGQVSLQHFNTDSDCELLLSVLAADELFRQVCDLTPARRPIAGGLSSCAPVACRVRVR